MVTPDEIADRLGRAGARWTTVRGVVRHHRRHDLVTIGFERYFAEPDGAAHWREGADPVDAVTAAELTDPRGIEAVLEVAAAQPGRRRVRARSRRGEDWLADLVVVDGDTWWARTEDGVITNRGDPHYGPGGTDELDLLTPGDVAAGYELTATVDREVVAGRGCTVVDAVPRPRAAGSRTPGSEVFAMITGGDRFRLAVDDRTGVVLRVVKFVDDAPAETVEFTEIAFDVPLADDLFAAIH